MEATESPVPQRNLLQRLHQALMPDYNSKATTYWWAMVLLGSGALGYSMWMVSSMPFPHPEVVAMRSLWSSSRAPNMAMSGSARPTVRRSPSGPCPTPSIKGAAHVPDPDRLAGAA